MQSWNRTSRFKSHLLLMWNFQMRLEMRCAIWNFWNFLRVAYLKLSNETWNKICYLKLFETWNFSTHHKSCLFETFRWDLKWDVLFETFETLQTYHGGLLFWNFQMRLETRYAIWNFLKLETFQPITGVAYLKLSDKTWNKICVMGWQESDKVHRKDRSVKRFHLFLLFWPISCISLIFLIEIWSFCTNLLENYPLHKIDQLPLFRILSLCMDHLVLIGINSL